MKKLVVVLIGIFVISSTLSAQGLFFTGGFSPHYRNMQLGVGYLAESNWGGRLTATFGVGYNEGEYFEDQGWNEYPDEVVDEGDYFNSFDLHYGYFLEHFYVTGSVGIAYETLYRNSYTLDEDIGNDGKYYITKSGDWLPIAGIEIGGRVNNLLIGVNYTVRMRIGFTVSYILNFDDEY